MSARSQTQETTSVLSSAPRHATASGDSARAKRRPVSKKQSSKKSNVAKRAKLARRQKPTKQPGLANGSLAADKSSCELLPPVETAISAEHMVCQEEAREAVETAPADLPPPASISADGELLASSERVAPIAPASTRDTESVAADRLCREQCENTLLRSVTAVCSALRRAVATGWNWFQERLKSQQSKKRLRVCESVSLGEKRFVAVIQVDGEQFLVGGSSSSVSTLAHLERSRDFSDVFSQRYQQDLGQA